MTAAGTDLNAVLPLFVYGTLCRGMANHARYLEGRTDSVVEAEIDGCIELVEEEHYPYLRPGPGIVKGELVFLSPGLFLSTLAEIDRLEDFDPDDLAASLYLRQTCLARTIDGERISAWTYFWNRRERPGRLISSGDFRREMHRVNARNG